MAVQESRSVTEQYQIKKGPIYEVWRGMKALLEHFEKPYVKQFVADSEN